MCIHIVVDKSKPYHLVERKLIKRHSCTAQKLSQQKFSAWVLCQLSMHHVRICRSRSKTFVPKMWHKACWCVADVMTQDILFNKPSKCFYVIIYQQSQNKFGIQIITCLLQTSMLTLRKECLQPLFRFYEQILIYTNLCESQLCSCQALK